VSYAIHGKPPEGDCKPPQAADFVTYRAAIMSTKGTVDKFIGDAVMAIWNAPAAALTGYLA
jgi:hypothetical protein